MIIYLINLILAVVIGFLIANIVRKYKVKQAIKKLEEFVEKTQPKENPTSEELFEAKGNIGRAKGKIEIIDKFNYFLW